MDTEVEFFFGEDGAVECVVVVDPRAAQGLVEEGAGVWGSTLIETLKLCIFLVEIEQIELHGCALWLGGGGERGEGGCAARGRAQRGVRSRCKNAKTGPHTLHTY